MLLGIVAWMTSLQKTGKTRLIMLGLSSLIVFVGFLSNFMLSKIVNKSPGMLFTNYAQTIYGISVGGQGWEKAYKDYPNLINMPEAISAGVLYHLALKEIYHDPLRTLKSVVGSWLDFLSVKNESVFGFASGGELIFRNIVDPKKTNIYIAWRIVLLGLSIAGLLKCWKSRQSPRYKLILFCCLGTLLSVPFLPPRDSALMRVYAATIISIIVIPAIGFEYILAMINHNNTRILLASSHRMLSRDLQWWFGICLVMMTLVGPILITKGTKLSAPVSHQCSDNLLSVVVRVIPGSVVNVIEDSKSPRIMPLFITRTTFLDSIADFPNKDLVLPLQKMSPPLAIANVYDIRTREYFWMVFHNPLYVNSPQNISACGMWNLEMAAWGLRFFETNDSHILQE